jgi:DNA-directed RNA polymerase subunit omega
MNRVSLDLLMTKVESKYTLVVAAAKRARMITEGASPLLQTKSLKPVTIALAEIANDKIIYEPTKIGIK